MTNAQIQQLLNDLSGVGHTITGGGTYAFQQLVTQQWLASLVSTIVGGLFLVYAAVFIPLCVRWGKKANWDDGDRNVAATLGFGVPAALLLFFGFIMVVTSLSTLINPQGSEVRSLICQISGNC